jgi:photosystem II stability/assembly factor-like uncharacterized protein
LYRTVEYPFDEVEQVLDCGFVPRIETFDAVEGTFATTRSGLYHSYDDGATWSSMGVPSSEVWTVLALSEDVVFAGTHKGELFKTMDGGDSWNEVSGFKQLPSRRHWETPKSAEEAWFRDLVAPAEAADPEILIAGIEAGGLHVSEDGGETWFERRDGQVKDDIHQVFVVDEEEFFVPSGRLDLGTRVRGDAGLYHTEDAGRSWRRLDRGLDYSYFRELLYHDGRLYACGSRTRPSVWGEGGSREQNDWNNGIGAAAALFESDDKGRTMRRVDYPGGPQEIILAWDVLDGQPIGGTGGWGAAMSPMANQGKEGRLIQRTTDGEYTTLGRIPAQVHSIGSI